MDLMRLSVVLAYIHQRYDVEREARGQNLKGEARPKLRRAQRIRFRMIFTPTWSVSNRRCCRRVQHALQIPIAEPAHPLPLPRRRSLQALGQFQQPHGGVCVRQRTQISLIVLFGDARSTRQSAIRCRSGRHALGPFRPPSLRGYTLKSCAH